MEALMQSTIFSFISHSNIISEQERSIASREATWSLLVEPILREAGRAQKEDIIGKQ